MVWRFLRWLVPVYCLAVAYGLIEPVGRLRAIWAMGLMGIAAAVVFYRRSPERVDGTAQS